MKRTAAGSERTNSPAPSGRQQRKKGEQQCGGAAEHRHRDLPGRADGRRRPRDAGAQEAGDVLHHHDRVVDQQPQGDHEPDDASWLMPKPVRCSSVTPIASESGIEIITTSGGAQAQRQQRHQNQQDRDQEVLGQPAEAGG